MGFIACIALLSLVTVASGTAVLQIVPLQIVPLINALNFLQRCIMRHVYRL